MTDFLVTFRGVPLIPPIECYEAHLAAISHKLENHWNP